VIDGGQLAEALGQPGRAKDDVVGHVASIRRLS
jgi:hypothetical protein